MSQTSVNEDADLASDVAISPSKTKKRASRPAPEPEPPKRRAKRQRYAGEDMAILTVRIPERERALCYADATETIRTINAHVIHRLKHLVAKKGGVVRGQDVHSFIEAHGQGLGQRFVIRLPVSLQEEVKALAERSDASVNALIRYALFQYPAPPSDMLPYRVRVYRGPSPLLLKENPTRGAKHSTYSGTPTEAYRSFRLPTEQMARLERAADVLDRSVNGQLIVATRNCLSLTKSKAMSVENLLSYESAAMTSPTSSVAAQIRDQQPVLDAFDRLVKKVKRPPFIVMSCIVEAYFRCYGALIEE
jgi:hypothetical protein